MGVNNGQNLLSTRWYRHLRVLFVRPFDGAFAAIRIKHSHGCHQQGPFTGDHGAQILAHFLKFLRYHLPRHIAQLPIGSSMLVKTRFAIGAAESVLVDAGPERSEWLV